MTDLAKIVWSSDSPAQSSSFSLDAGRQIEYATSGPPPSTAATIVLLHEGLGCVKLWRNFPQMLSAATGCGVFAYSRLGYGQSTSITPPLPITRMADEASATLPLLIDAIAPTKLILIGHSDGGTIAAHYLAGATHPALKAAILMSAHFFCEPSNITAIRETTAAFEGSDLRPRLAKYHADVEGAFYGWADTWLDPAFAQWDMRSDLAHWRHPVLFMQGRDDPYGSAAQAEAVLASPHARMEWLNDCAHSPHLEQQAQALDLISSFISDNLNDV